VEASQQHKLIVPVIGAIMSKVLQEEMAEAGILDSLPLDVFKDHKHLAPILKWFYPMVKPPTSNQISHTFLLAIYQHV
jgi:hypothetical protein